jgi:putative membrane protein
MPMTFKTMILVSSAVLTLSACHKAAITDVTTTNSTVAATTAKDTSAPAAPVSAGQAFANTAAASDAFEIETSKLALTNVATPSIKSYAQKMIGAHTDSTAKLKAAAASAAPAITPDATLTADQQQKLVALKALTGKAFDQAYVADQAAGHQQTLDALRTYSASGDVPQLQAFATTLVPIVTAHLNMAKGLRA